MSYELALLPQAEREWKGLDGSIKQIFKKKLQKCLDTPRIRRISYRYKDFTRSRWRDRNTRGLSR